MTPDDFRAWRTRLGLSLTGAGAALGVTRRAVMMYQSGDRPVSLPIAKLCAALEATTAETHRSPPSSGLSSRSGRC